MRVLFTVVAGPTHYFHLVPLAWGFRAAGHEVRVAGQPPVLDAITQSGLTAVSVGGDYDFLAGIAAVQQAVRRQLDREPRPEDAQKLPPEVVRQARAIRLEPHVKATEAMAAELVPFARAWQPDLVVAVPIALAAPLAAAAAGAPLVNHLWGPDAGRYVGYPGSGLAAEDWPDDLQRLYRAFDVPVRAEYASRIVDPCPTSMQLPTVPNRYPMRYVPYNGPGVAPEWLSRPAGRPRICVSWSTLNTRLAGTESFAVPEILNALADPNLEVVVAVKESDQHALTDLPSNVRLVAGLPLHLLLPTCAAIIHHGGTGTMFTAAYYGVPQVVVAPIFDQAFSAERLSATGAGIALNAADAGADAIHTAASKVLSDEAYRDGAARLREEILAQPSPAEVVDALTHADPRFLTGEDQAG